MPITEQIAEGRASRPARLTEAYELQCAVCCSHVEIAKGREHCPRCGTRFSIEWFEGRRSEEQSLAPPGRDNISAAERIGALARP